MIKSTSRPIPIVRMTIRNTVNTGESPGSEDDMGPRANFSVSNARIIATPPFQPLGRGQSTPAEDEVPAHPGSTEGDRLYSHHRTFSPSRLSSESARQHVVQSAQPRKAGTVEKRRCPVEPDGADDDDSLPAVRSRPIRLANPANKSGNYVYRRPFSMQWTGPQRRERPRHAGAALCWNACSFNKRAGLGSSARPYFLPKICSTMPDFRSLLDCSAASHVRFHIFLGVNFTFSGE